MPQRLYFPVLADNPVLHDGEEMEVLGHDDIVLDGDHGIMRMDGMEQLVLHHLPDGRQRRTGCVGTAVGG